MNYDNSHTSIVVVDDDEHVCNLIAEALASEKYQLATFTNPKEALDYIENNRVDLALTDLVMGGYSGVQVIDTVRENHTDAVVLLMTAHPTVETAISVLKKGVYDFLIKPFKLDLLRATIKRGLDHQRVLRENLQLKGEVEFLKVVAEGGAEKEHDIGHFLEMVAESCRRELTASAVGLIQIDPRSRTALRTVSLVDDEEFADEVTDPETIERFGFTRSHRPIVRSTTVTRNNREFCKVSITQPIFVRRRLNGVINIVVVSRFDPITPGQLNLLAILANTASSAIANHNLYQDLQASYLHAISGLANSIEARDAYTAGHTERVSILAEILARRLGWNESRIRNLRMGCTLHDIGKIGVPDSILNKAGALTKEELAQMRSHPEVGLKIIHGIQLFQPAVPYISDHHENYDGSGYPRGLRGEEISIEGRLLSIADTFDAILSDRPYRKGREVSRAVSELLENRGRQFDPLLVNIFVDVLITGGIDVEGMYGRSFDVGEIEAMVAATSRKVSV